MQILKITDVKPEGQAMKLGILPGDYLHLYNDVLVTSNEQLSFLIADNCSNAININLFRKNEIIEVEAQPGPLGISAIVCEYTAYDENKIRYAKVILTTAPSISSYTITKTIDIITAECAMGINIFGDFFSGIADTFGGRDGVTQNALRKARKYCLEELRKEADSIGANAVIAVDLDYSEFTGKGKSMLFLVASGTAVVVEQIVEG